MTTNSGPAPAARGPVQRIALGGGDKISVQRPWPQPSNYSLSSLELACHVRQLRRSGWQSWEINARFDFSHQDAA